MSDKIRQLCSDYTVKFADYQYKRRKKTEKYVLIGIILIFLIDFITHPKGTNITKLAPFLPKLEIEDVDKTSKRIMNAIRGDGDLAEDINTTIDNISPLYNYITNSTKTLPRTLNIDKKQSRKVRRMIEETVYYEQQSNISLLVNQMLFNRKWKMWNTQRDSRVRKTEFHNNIDRTIVGINDWFIVGEHKALYPAHSYLKDYDRFNCRCYLTYE
mgnify:CR=1 FL=1